MGKLNIAHHKSYHPYRRDNIERVRRDEEEARLKEAQEDGRMMLADSEARIDLLRQRVGIETGSSLKKKKERGDSDMKALDKIESQRHREREEGRASGESSTMGPPPLPTTNGHINLFEDLEQNAIAMTMKTKKKEVPEEEKGVALAPSEKDLKPWYSSKDRLVDQHDDDPKKVGRRQREDIRKSQHDPLTSITKQLSTKSSPPRSKPRAIMPTPASSSSVPPELNARLKRESSERERALALIKRKKREMKGSATPSTVHGGADDEYQYGDQYNRRAVEEAHASKDRDRRWVGDWGPGAGQGRQRGWDDDDKGDERRRGERDRYHGSERDHRRSSHPNSRSSRPW